MLPISKLGETKTKTEAANYRPISLLSILSKVFEKVIHFYLFKHLNKNIIIIPQQFGFREHHSCIQQLQRVTEFATIETNKNRYIQMILLDTKGIRLWPLIKLINNYLNNRKMYVTVKGSNSSIKQVKIGLPQGSIFGPTLYNIYTNDIPHTNSTHIAMYADDMAIYTSS